MDTIPSIWAISIKSAYRFTGVPSGMLPQIASTEEDETDKRTLSRIASTSSAPMEGPLSRISVALPENRSIMFRLTLDSPSMRTKS
ncbi:hypothetical protein D3C75_886790 [compost metagenome]